MTDKALKILITGANGVGKTALANALSQKLNLTLIPEVSRKLCTEKGFEDLTAINDKTGFAKMVLDHQLKAEENLSTFIADRGCVDCWAHYLRWLISTNMTYDSEKFYQKCFKGSLNYNKIIFIPQMFRAQNDGFRWVDPDYLKQMERIIKSILYEFDLLPITYTLKTDNITDRQNEVLKWLAV